MRINVVVNEYNIYSNITTLRPHPNKLVNNKIKKKNYKNQTLVCFIFFHCDLSGVDTEHQLHRYIHVKITRYNWTCII